MTKKETESPARNVRLMVPNEKHDRIKQLRNAIQYKRKTDINLLDMYQEILEQGIRTLEKEENLNLEPAQ